MYGEYMTSLLDYGKFQAAQSQQPRSEIQTAPRQRSQQYDQRVYSAIFVRRHKTRLDPFCYIQYKSSL